MYVIVLAKTNPVLTILSTYLYKTINIITILFQELTLITITAEYMNASVIKRGSNPSTVCMKKFCVNFG